MQLARAEALKRNLLQNGVTPCDLITTIQFLLDDVAEQSEQIETLGQALKQLAIGFNDYLTGVNLSDWADPLEVIRKQLSDDDCLRHAEIRRRNEEWEVVVHKEGKCGLGVGRDWNVAYALATRNLRQRASRAESSGVECEVHNG